MALPHASRTAALVAALASAFVAGALAGSAGHGGSEPQPSVVDEAAARITTDAANQVNPDKLQQAAIAAMVSELGDRWASYYAPGDDAQLRALLDGRYSGLGVWLRRDAASHILVASVLPQSPAGVAGLQIGDRLMSVGGSTVAGLDLGSVVAALRGPVGSSVTIVVRRGGSDSTLTLQRTELAVSDVTTDVVAPGVSRIRIAAFTRGVGRQVDAMVTQLRAQHVRGIVLDLRGDPGGLLDEAVAVSSVFLDGGPVVSYGGRTTGMHRLQATRGGDTTTPVAVLVDGGTASAAEVVTAALQERGRAVVVGSRTFGKGSVQEPIRLSDGSAIEITVGRYFTPKGRSLDGTGITPDIPVEGTDSAVAVARAVDVLTGLLAYAGTTTGRG